MVDTVYKRVNNYYFDPADPLGKGCFGTVYLGHHTENQEAKYAVKAIPLGILQDEMQKELVMREIAVLRQLKSEYIVQLIDVIRTANNLYIIMEYCDGGDLDTKLKNDVPFTEKEACLIVKQIARAFLDIENIDVGNSEGKVTIMMHRDIKPANILFHKGKIKLADFGFAKIIDDTDKDIRRLHTSLGTPLYSPPQILGVKKYNYKCDVWSTGIVLYQLLFTQTPWTARSEYELHQNIMKEPLKFPRKINSDIEDLIKGMLAIDEGERLSWRDIYNHLALKDCKI